MLLARIRTRSETGRSRTDHSNLQDGATQPVRTENLPLGRRRLSWGMRTKRVTARTLTKAILRWLAAQPVRPPKLAVSNDKQLDGKTYFAVLAGVRTNFAELKIHLSRYPEWFTNMNYAESQTFPLNGFFSRRSRRGRIRELGDVLKRVALRWPAPRKTRCVPYLLIVEKPNKEEPFYESETYPVGLGGTGETAVDHIFIGSRLDGRRYEAYAIGTKDIIAVSLDDGDEEVMEVIGLKNVYRPVEFGHVTFKQARRTSSYKKRGQFMTVTSSDGNETVWSVEDSFIW
jgi:hypothetical protein